MLNIAVQFLFQKKHTPLINFTMQQYDLVSPIYQIKNVILCLLDFHLIT
jgi:hypothetical protein